jgi:hypothetical protein
MHNLSIVTSCAGYGQYLGEWAESLAALTRKPAMVGIVTQGAEQDVAAAIAAAGVLRKAGLTVKLQHLAGPVDLGTARNAAVALSETDWVMHLDADDMLMPWALEDVARLAPEADVIALGYRRCGDLKSGPRQGMKLYKSSVGLETLDNPTPASGVSPFRRSFWERCPYRTDMTGGWDTALWLGFARLGARVRATDRPCFWYRQHRDSIFNLRRKSGWPARRTGMKLQSLRRGDEGVAILVPWAPDRAERDAAWSWIGRRYDALLPEWDLRLGVSDPAMWRKGEAIRDALHGCTAAVLVIADADCLVEPAVLRRAVELVETGRAHWVVPHTRVIRMGAEQTAALLAGDPAGEVLLPEGKLAREPYLGFAGGGMLVVGRAEFEATGGIPRGFLGWGAEDECLGVILDTLLGPHVRLDADLLHCWHKPAAGRYGATRSPGYRQNRALFQRYLRTADNPERLWAALDSGHAPRPGTYFDPVTRLATAAERAGTLRDEASRMIRDTFAERRLAALQPMRPKMSTALDLKHAHRASRLAQAERNAIASRARLAEMEAHQASPKAILAAPANKMAAPAVNKGVKFASPQAMALAQGSGLPLSAFEAIDAGPRGVTLAQVREVVG